MSERHSTIPPEVGEQIAVRLQRALWVLALLEILTGLLGLPPPGLRHLSVFLPAHVPPTAAVNQADWRDE